MAQPRKLATAKKVADAAAAEAAKRKWDAFCITIVGPSGDLVYFEKLDNCQYASIEISQHKARTAARYRRPTLVFERLLAKGGFFAYLTTLDNVIASRGGNPLIVGGKVIGAIGVSGGAARRMTPCRSLASRALSNTVVNTMISAGIFIPAELFEQF
jgi:uncharacterized protein GlcG (DUF336 family)